LKKKKKDERSCGEKKDTAGGDNIRVRNHWADGSASDLLKKKQSNENP